MHGKAKVSNEMVPNCDMRAMKPPYGVCGLMPEDGRDIP